MLSGARRWYNGDGDSTRERESGWDEESRERGRWYGEEEEEDDDEEERDEKEEERWFEAMGVAHADDMDSVYGEAAAIEGKIIFTQSWPNTKRGE